MLGSAIFKTKISKLLFTKGTIPNESKDFVQQVEPFKEDTGYYPVSVHVVDTPQPLWRGDSSFTLS